MASPLLLYNGGSHDASSNLFRTDLTIAAQLSRARRSGSGSDRRTSKCKNINGMMFRDVSFDRATPRVRLRFFAAGSRWSRAPRVDTVDGLGGPRWTVGLDIY
jgi:hypothetical protein